MRVKVSDILAREAGHRANFKVEGERPQLADVALAGGLSGEISITRTAQGLLAEADLTAGVELECHRCLRVYASPLRVRFQAVYTEHPREDEWPIEHRTDIDLDPPLRQEILLSLPIKQLCEPDCPGLCGVCGQRLDRPHRHRSKTKKG